MTHALRASQPGKQRHMRLFAHLVSQDLEVQGVTGRQPCCHTWRALQDHRHLHHRRQRPAAVETAAPPVRHPLLALQLVLQPHSVTVHWQSGSGLTTRRAAHQLLQGPRPRPWLLLLLLLQEEAAAAAVWGSHNAAPSTCSMRAIPAQSSALSEWHHQGRQQSTLYCCLTQDWAMTSCWGASGVSMRSRRAGWCVGGEGVDSCTSQAAPARWLQRCADVERRRTATMVPLFSSP